jgi:hypothetical protein
MMPPQPVLLPPSKINVAAYACMIRTHLVVHHSSAVCSIRTAAAVNAHVNAAEDAAAVARADAIDAATAAP